jgi:uncharacterized protein YhbP (UPF0306 family)
VKGAGSPNANDVRDRVSRYLQAHHTMTIATVAAAGIEPHATTHALLHPTPQIAPHPTPHAASVFYAVDDSLRLVFLSRPSSLHGSHIGRSAPVAVTVSEDYEDWEQIRGVQLWGEARLLGGVAKARALALYLTRFPFVRDMLDQPGLADLVRGIGIYRIVPERVAFTDNTTGVFGREVLELVAKRAR